MTYFESQIMRELERIFSSVANISAIRSGSETTKSQTPINPSSQLRDLELIANQLRSLIKMREGQKPHAKATLLQLAKLLLPKQKIPSRQPIKQQTVPDLPTQPIVQNTVLLPSEIEKLNLMKVPQGISTIRKCYLRRDNQNTYHLILTKSGYRIGRFYSVGDAKLWWQHFTQHDPKPLIQKPNAFIKNTRKKPFKTSAIKRKTVAVTPPVPPNDQQANKTQDAIRKYPALNPPKKRGAPRPQETGTKIGEYDWHGG